MQNQIIIAPVVAKYRDAIISLLQAEGLPVDDLPAELSRFYMATDNGFVIGLIGLEVYERVGLLRSLTVKPEYRRMKIAASMVNEVENLGRSLGLKAIYLLTETAEGYFSRNGYIKIERSTAPISLQQSSEFRGVCPSTAITMKKTL
jgi:amino-acid N-acetyltransferase